MSGCCEEHETKTKVKKVKYNNEETKPKSFIGKYLYNVGKKDAEKGAKQPKKGCC